MTSSKLCTVALFMKDTENVENYCKTEVEPNSILREHITSLMVYILYGLTFTVVCHQEQKDSHCKPSFRYNQAEYGLYCYK